MKGTCTTGFSSSNLTKRDLTPGCAYRRNEDTIGAHGGTIYFVLSTQHIISIEPDGSIYAMNVDSMAAGSFNALPANTALTMTTQRDHHTK